MRPLGPLQPCRVTLTHLVLSSVGTAWGKSRAHSQRLGGGPPSHRFFSLKAHEGTLTLGTTDSEVTQVVAVSSCVGEDPGLWNQGDLCKSLLQHAPALGPWEGTS